ncbi:MAG TPA: mercury resistance system transport protein MerF [Candidatus Udaeobacter sp.]|nr:mercury resistance system transport protein MerF [Candidatus Udaeobacter sp.]
MIDKRGYLVGKAVGYREWNSDQTKAFFTQLLKESAWTNYLLQTSSVRIGAGRVMDGNKCFKAGIWGSIIAAICCFTPVLVTGLGLIGLAAFTPYLDYVLFPLLGLFLILAYYGWSKTRKGNQG